MLFSRRIAIKQLAGLCRRTAISLSAGVDVRTVWSREVQRASGQVDRERIQDVSQAIGQGETLAAALAATGDYFPPLMRELVDVGERTGHLSEVLTQLAEHYENQIDLRRTFLAAATWPLIELAAAVTIIGFLILALGVIENLTGTRVDPLGLGLIGVPGLVVYLAALTAVVLAFFFVLRAIRRGLAWTRPIQRAVLRLPGVGGPLRTLALARLAWTLHLTFKTGMEVRRSLRLSLGTTRNATYTDHIETIDAQIEMGHSLHEAFLAAGVFPSDFLDSVAVAEQSGRMTESMDLLARQYLAQARMAMATLTKVGGFAVWVLVAAAIILLIFKLASFYIGILEDAARM